MISQGWRERYAYAVWIYIIFGSEAIKRLSLFSCDLFEMRWGEPCNLFKLRRQVVHTAETGLIRDLGEGKLIVDEEFLYFFCTLQYEELLDGPSFN